MNFTQNKQKPEGTHKRVWLTKLHDYTSSNKVHRDRRGLRKLCPISEKFTTETDTSFSVYMLVAEDATGEAILWNLTYDYIKCFKVHSIDTVIWNYNVIYTNGDK